MNLPKVLTILGTRPEAIKLCPVIRRLYDFDHEIKTYVLVTGQHRAMLDQILQVFQVTPDFDLDIMQPDQSLTDITVRTMRGLEAIFRKEDYQLVLVQGDTTTAFAGALSAFYHRVPIGHVEAGLRTHNKYNPYPEEANRHFIDVLADACYAPTPSSKNALIEEGMPPERILVTGNTVIDALLTTVKKDYRFKLPELQRVNFVNGRKILLFTVHRRENHGQPLREICTALRQIIENRNDLQIILPVHPNPNVHLVVHSVLGGIEDVHLIEPLDYPDFANLMARAHLIVTDSGGVQEEAPSLGKPVLVIRETTERPEAIEVGSARLIGTQREGITEAINQLMDSPGLYNQMARANNPYGDGCATERIIQAIRYSFQLSDHRPDEFIPHQPVNPQLQLSMSASII